MIRIQSFPRCGATAGALLLAALTAACSPTTSTPAADPSAAVPTFGASDMPPGTHVQVARAGQWFPATIVQPLGEGRFMIHYDNYGNEFNEVVGPDRLKTAGGGPGAGPAHDYKPGDKVLVTYQGRLLVADVAVQVTPESWKVHYDGWGPEASETVGPDRVRRPFTGTSAHAVGEALIVDVNGQALPGKVIAASAADRWIVRFDGYGAQYDQEVGVDRLRAAPAVAPPPPVAVAPPAPVEPEKPAAPAKPEKPEKPAPKPKPAPVVEAAPAPQSGPPAPTETVLVSIRGAYFPATVVAPGAAGTFKVKFATGEEEVPADKLLREPASLKGLHYQVGQLVLVHYKGVYVAAKVLKQEGKADYKVRFEGTGPEEDEVVGVRRLRPR
jgi:hypothetical protein